MRFSRYHARAWATLAAVIALPLPALAAAAIDSGAGASPQPVAVRAPERHAPGPEPGTALAGAPPSAPTSFSGFGAASDTAQLNAQRGGAELVHNEAKLDGLVSGNTATNVLSGANTINDGAFSNAAGIPIVIQNSGANVLIQNATIVNLQLR